MDSKTLSMIRKYCDQEDLPDDGDDEDVYAKTTYLPSSNETNTSYPSIFSNPLIQTSFTLYSNLKRILLRKENLTLIHYLFKWHSIRSASSSVSTTNYFQSNTTMVNKNIIEKVLNDPIPIQEEYGDEADIEAEGEPDEGVEEEGDYNNDDNTDEVYKANYNKGAILITAMLKAKLKSIMESFYSKSYLAITRKKLSTSQLTLLYIFTELAICKTKESKLNQKKKEESSNQSSNHIAEGINQQLKDKIYELEKLNKKYENILDEKSQIIIKKNDEIESLNEKIEDLSKSNVNRNNLNIIHESLCSRCGNSLEESFISESVSESKKVIHEQLIYIEKMQKEISELKAKNGVNEVKLKDLDEIKKEFKVLTETFQKEKIDEGVQTDPIPQLTSQSNATHTNGKGKKKRPKTNNTIITTNKKKITNYNIINIKTAGNPQAPVNASSFSSSSMGNNTTGNNNNLLSTAVPVELKDALQSLRFDNSVLSTELLNLNKELNHYRTENKILAERMGKWDKEKTDILSKLKAKSENYDKTKKENEDLMLLIQNSKNKGVITLETENKKLRSDLSMIQTENEVLKKGQMKNDKRFQEQEIQVDRMKKMLEGFSSFKAQKENMILENTKMQSEIKRLRYDLEESKNEIEKQNIIMNTKEKEIAQLNEDVTYYSFNARKSKQDADRALQDAMAYQKIVRKMEKELAEAQIRNGNMK